MLRMFLELERSFPETSEASQEEDAVSSVLGRTTAFRRFFGGAVHWQVAPATTGEKYQHHQDRGPQMHCRRARTRDLCFGNFTSNGEASDFLPRAGEQRGAAKYRLFYPAGAEGPLYGMFGGGCPCGETIQSGAGIVRIFPPGIGMPVTEGRTAIAVERCPHRPATGARGTGRH